ncbi:hypothetical protein D3C80_1699990 [compost metagenome]
MQGLDLVAARHAKARDGAVQALVEGLFEFAPLAQRTVLHARHTRSGRRLGSFSNIFGGLLRLLLGLLAILHQRVEQLRAVLVDLRIDTKPRQPDLAGVLLDPADPGAAFFLGILLASHPALLMVCARRARAARAAVQA